VLTDSNWVTTINVAKPECEQAMKKFKRIVLFGWLLVLPQLTFAVEDRAPALHFDLSWGYASTKRTAALTAAQMFRVPLVESLQLGYGVRLTSFWGFSQDFETADRNLFQEDRIDTVNIADPFLNSANLGLYSHYELTELFGLGINLDFIGLGFGPSRNGNFRSRTRAEPFDIVASPSHFNLWTVGNSDHGMLNSEFFVTADPFESMRVRLGFSHYRGEYQTRFSPADKNDRFKYSGNLIFLAASYILQP